MPNQLWNVKPMRLLVSQGLPWNTKPGSEQCVLQHLPCKTGAPLSCSHSDGWSSSASRRSICRTLPTRGAKVSLPPSCERDVEVEADDDGVGVGAVACSTAISACKGWVRTRLRPCCCCRCWWWWCLFQVEFSHWMKRLQATLMFRFHFWILLLGTKVQNNKK